MPAIKDLITTWGSDFASSPVMNTPNKEIHQELEIKTPPKKKLH